ncbi:MAG: putative MFS family arabinose efflux permease [Cellvibrionaceae bacterium]|jgi:predicted MFS family arabinose efflux permease
MTQIANTPSTSSRITTRTMIIIILILRIVMDTGTKLFFPYLSVIAIGLGTTPVELGKLLSWRNMTGLISPFLGAMADRRGYRPIVSGSLIFAGIGFLIIFFSRSQTGFMIGILLGALGGAGANPNISAYLSHRLPWEKRSRGLGVVEYAWGLASIIGVSLSGVLIAFTSWRAPFLIIGCAMFVFAAVFYRFPSSGREEEQQTQNREKSSTLTLREKIFDFFYLGPNWRSAVATLIADSFTRFAGFLLFINFGTWLTIQFDLNTAGLAAAVFWLGFADICGSVAVSAFGDRIGKRKSVISGTIIGALFFLVLPLWQGSLAWVIVGIFLARAAFEFSIVSYSVLASEQTPEHRGKMLAQRVALSLVSTFMATRFGPQIFEAYSVTGFAWISAASLGISCLVAIFMINDGLSDHVEISQ